MIPTVQLAPDYTVPRLIKGGWQLAGGHGVVDRQRALNDMTAYAAAGITAFDCADIYTGVEELIGDFLRQWRAAHGPNAPRIRVHTKCVPDRERLATLRASEIDALIDRSLTRLRVDTLDLVQLHWWDFAVPGVEDAALRLRALRQAGKIRHIGVTNFDTPTLRAVLDAGVPVVSHQLQLSLLDQRALGAMAALCAERNIGVLAYGALAGGFFHEQWLGVPEPVPPLENRSLTKYKLIIDEFGGWDAFQALLRVLRDVAHVHATTIGAVALRCVLDTSIVSAVIVGARSDTHLSATLAALQIALTDDESRSIHAHVAGRSGPAGDVYALERVAGGRHAAIMRTNLNAV